LRFSSEKGHSRTEGWNGLTKAAASILH
jgi:hypothetical protein